MNQSPVSQLLQHAQAAQRAVQAARDAAKATAEAAEHTRPGKAPAGQQQAPSAGQ